MTYRFDTECISLGIVGWGNCCTSKKSGMRCGATAGHSGDHYVFRHTKQGTLEKVTWTDSDHRPGPAGGAQGS